MKIPNTKEVIEMLTLNQSEFGRLIGIKQPSVSYRVKNNIPLTWEESLSLEDSHNISRHITRPDVFGQAQRVNPPSS